jgi:hypothetical protein
MGPLETIKMPVQTTIFVVVRYAVELSQFVPTLPRTAPVRSLFVLFLAVVDIDPQR